jgi:hypothetical protein
MNLISIITLVLQITPKLLDAILYAEKLYSGMKQGKLKKQYVMRIIENAIESGEIIHPVISAYKQQFINALSQFVDSLVAIMNATGVFSDKVKIDTTPKEG